MNKKFKLPGLLILTLLVAGVSIYYLKFHHLPSDGEVIQPIIDSIQVKKTVHKVYGIEADSYEMVTDKIKRNQTLTDILQELNMPKGWRQRVVTIPREDFDLRKIRSGNRYTLFFSKDTSRVLQYFIYEHTPIDYVKFDFRDSLLISKEQKEVSNLRKTAHGSISSSLWNAMVEKDINPILANDLSDIYAWSIDFFGLQPLDSFHVVYSEQFVDTVSVGLGKIHAAFFKHAGTEFYAIPFVQDSVESYYDLEGKSLRKTFLKAPLSYSRISSGFSHNRKHPILKIRRPHHGVDYSAPSGTPVQAIGDGKIIKAARGYNRGAGNMIKIKHNSVYTTAYLHLRGFASGIKVGSYVKQGDVIGYVGSTGLSTGPHLDFRFYKNGKAIDPLKVEAPPVEPVHEENQLAFDSVKTATLNLLR